MFDQFWVRIVRMSSVLWCGLKPNCLSEMVIQEVAPKLTLYYSLHDLADDTKQGDGPVHGWIRFCVPIVDRNNMVSLPIC